MNSPPRHGIARHRSARSRKAVDERRVTRSPGGRDLLEAARTVTERTRKLRARSAALAEANTAVHGENERFADLYDFLPIPYLIVSNVGIIEHVNDSAVQFFGGEREWIVGRPLIVHVQTEDMRKVLDCLLGSSTAFSQSTEVRLRAHDGFRVVQIITRRRREEVPAPATFHIAIVDLSEVRRLDEDRRVAERERQRSQDAERVARAASEAKDEFLAMLSHELRTPLTPVLAAVDSLLSSGTLPDEPRARIDIIRRNVKAEAHLIDDLLDVARITGRKLDVNRRPTDLHRVLSGIVDAWLAPLQKRQIALTVRLEADEHWVHGDAGRLGQVFLNLITNASKFTEAGGRITVASESCDGAIRVRITDTGAGISEAQIAALFKPFRPASPHSARHGLGLGLVISAAIVEAHEGTLAVSSEGPGQGTTVRLELPVIARPPDVVEEPAVRATSPAVTGKVLLVEDDPDSAAMLTMMLSLEGFQVETAASVHAALQRIECCDVLVSDISLPDGSGLDLMRQIRANGRTVRGIALSGYGSAQDVTRSLEAGFEEHLTKPVEMERLIGSVRRLTETKN